MVDEVPLRILVIGNLPPHVMGGAENQIARLVEAWLGAGAHVEVAGHRIPDGVQALGASRLQTHCLKAWTFGGRAGRALGYFASLARLALTRRRDFDVVYCRGIGDGVLGLVALAALGQCRWPIVACPINARGAGDVAFLRTVPGWRTWRLLIDRHVAAINLINEAIAQDLDAEGIVRAPRSRIPNGIGLRQPVERSTVHPARRLLWTGRIDHQKALDLLMPALATCKSEGAKFQLSLLGDGPLRAQLMGQVEDLGLTREVRFLGAVEAGRVRDHLLDADVFVLPSRYEGMSNSALEAMEAGLPVLCTRCGGIDEAVSAGAGWVCAPEHPEDLLGSMRALFAAPDATVLQYGRTARRIVEERFGIERVAAENLELLTGVARRRDVP